ncbi:MAG: CPBP family intramembrane metalloprotease [Candidatus Moranbacteria bacterium]|nr:CPBP family intramembrane metalloprotease [Candidatus Moranbacteria bacterium]
MQKFESLNSKDLNKNNNKNFHKIYEYNPALLSYLYGYLKNPPYQSGKISKNFFLKFWDIVRLGAISAVVSFMLAVIIVYLISLTDYDQNSHAIMELILDKENIWILMILAVIFAPVKEELTFRMILKYSAFRFSFSLAFLLLLLPEILLNFFDKSFIFDFKWWQGAIVYFGFIFLAGFGFGFLFKRFFKKEKIESFYKNNFFKIFYLQAIAFGLVHIINYQEVLTIWFIVPMLVMPQIFLGLILGFIRMKFGLIWSIFFHAMYNGIALLPFLILSNVSDEFYNKLVGNNFSPMDFNNISQSDLSILFLSGIFFLFFTLLIIVSLAHLIIEAVVAKKSKKI